MDLVSPLGNRSRRALFRQLQRQASAPAATKARPTSEDFVGAYSTVSYDRWFGRANVNKVWDFLGGRLKAFRGGDTCAARVSYALNNGGAPITERDDGWIYPNHAHIKWGRSKEPGDGKKYIVSAPYLQKYLRRKWGKPDATLKTNDEAKQYAKSLASNEIAVFAGPHHAGIITESSPRDPYVFSDPDVMPVSVWRLPTRGGVLELKAPV